MTLETLKSNLSAYTPGFPDEDSNVVQKFTKLLDTYGDKCLHRDLFIPGHIVASGLVIDPTNKMILLNHHKSLNMWLAFGGHVDGDPDSAMGALREVQEESSLAAPRLLSANIIDLDIHTIPSNPKKDEPEHLHYDIAYIFGANINDDIAISDESVNVKWCAFEDALEKADRGSMNRLINKAIESIS